jgi:hypothetical protein
MCTVLMHLIDPSVDKTVLQTWNPLIEPDPKVHMCTMYLLSYSYSVFFSFCMHMKSIHTHNLQYTNTSHTSHALMKKYILKNK